MFRISLCLCVFLSVSALGCGKSSTATTTPTPTQTATATTAERLPIRAFTVSMSRPAEGVSVAQTSIMAVAADGTLTASSTDEGNLDNPKTAGKFTSSGELQGLDGTVLASMDGNGVVTVQAFATGVRKLTITKEGTVNVVRHDGLEANKVIAWNADGSLGGTLMDDAPGWTITSDAPPEGRRLASYLLAIQFFMTDLEAKAQQPAATIEAPAVAPLLADCPME